MKSKRARPERTNSVQNALKVYRGQIAGTERSVLDGSQDERRTGAAQIDRRKSGTAEDVRRCLGRDCESPQGISDLHSRAPDLRAEGGFNSTLFEFARTLVRLAAENEKPNAERLPEYTDARRASLELGLYSPAPIHEDFEKLKLADSLAFMVELLGADNALVKQVLDGKTPEARANELITGTKLKDVEFRKELAQGWQGCDRSFNRSDDRGGAIDRSEGT